MPKPTLHLFPLPIHEDQIAFANDQYVDALVNADVIIAERLRTDYKVVPILGPNSIFLALMASGLNGQNFAFRGYLPVKDAALISELRQVEQRISKDHQTQIYIETPYRNDRLLKTITNKMQGHHKLCLAINVTADSESISTKTIGEWKKNLPTIGKEFCIFLMG